MECRVDHSCLGMVEELEGGGDVFEDEGRKDQDDGELPYRSRSEPELEEAI